jgi:hypothetical protein
MEPDLLPLVKELPLSALTDGPNGKPALVYEDDLRERLAHLTGRGRETIDALIDRLIALRWLAPLTVWRCPAADGWPSPTTVYRRGPAWPETSSPVPA